MIAVDLFLMFTLGLVSSLHCLQMCGPIVLAYSVVLCHFSAENPQPKFSPLLWNHIAYNSGRIVTYSLLGALAGVIGSSMALLGKLTGFGGTLALIAGGLMLVIGLAMFGVLPGSKLLTTRALQFTRGVLKPCSGFLQSPGVGNRFILGLGLGLLPCGILYAALIKAAATASPLRGAGDMLAFGLGTAGSLVAIGVFSTAIRVKLNRWNAYLVGSSVTAMGLLLLWRGMMASDILMSMHHAHH